MSLAEAVRDRLEKTPAENQTTLRGKLLEAEKLADKFSDVKPVPYILPIEVAIGTFYRPE